MHGIRQVAVSRRPVNDDCFKASAGNCMEEALRYLQEGTEGNDSSEVQV